MEPKLNALNAICGGVQSYSQLLEDNNCKINENAFAIYSTIHFDCFYPAEGNAGIQSQPNIKAIEKPSFRNLDVLQQKSETKANSNSGFVRSNEQSNQTNESENHEIYLKFSHKCFQSRAHDKFD